MIFGAIFLTRMAFKGAHVTVDNFQQGKVGWGIAQMVSTALITYGAVIVLYWTIRLFVLAFTGGGTLSS